MQIFEHWLQEAETCPSPHYNTRPDPEDISLLVIHNIALPPKTYGGGWIEKFFQGQLPPTEHPYFESLAGVRVSAHLLIERTGRLIQFVAFNQRAWHAGQSYFQGRENCNDFSIGIEMEGSDDQPYTQVQYQQLIKVTRSLMHVYPGITQERICSHASLAHGRKTDPGPAFDWQSYLAEL
ncbi:AmpD protein [Marinospirillum celere]|uniref:1,6-anhydro-N-acetylmuramyl-L-alanine amidase AmpD n=1 Tax=Marinospirillum celere TaxID=1122252 RepID=A0A1I1GWU2_9GAMM|nr:1,6-anhydro-N-acetylmuramyl-L-alanine amidase AmpD [Marinospirillum celere]SFC16309.1 AmpD protein [Marinospirillum celere]